MAPPPSDGVRLALRPRLQLPVQHGTLCPDAPREGLGGPARPQPFPVSRPFVYCKARHQHADPSAGPTCFHAPPRTRSSAPIMPRAPPSAPEVAGRTISHATHSERTPDKTRIEFTGKEFSGAPEKELQEIQEQNSGERRASLRAPGRVRRGTPAGGPYGRAGAARPDVLRRRAVSRGAVRAYSRAPAAPRRPRAGPPLPVRRARRWSRRSCGGSVRFGCGRSRSPCRPGRWGVGCLGR